MFAPVYVQHRGARVLRIDYSELSREKLVEAAAHIRRIVTAEPPRSVRTLTLLNTLLTADAAEALKEAAVANAMHIRASAVVGTAFWRSLAAQVPGREMRLFDDEASALDWLAAQ
jgi:hypothetical protein